MFTNDKKTFRKATYICLTVCTLFLAEETQAMEDYRDTMQAFVHPLKNDLVDGFRNLEREFRYKKLLPAKDELEDLFSDPLRMRPRTLLEETLEETVKFFDRCLIRHVKYFLERFFPRW